ncbi:MAG: hypothetical protein M5F18_10195 [Asgard group archaeon]|nr:hypothetical protein [Asgard group archaeon]
MNEIFTTTNSQTTSDLNPQIQTSFSTETSSTNPQADEHNQIKAIEDDNTDQMATELADQHKLFSASDTNQDCTNIPNQPFKTVTT